MEREAKLFTKTNPFTSANYPKTYASIQQGDYRLQAYLGGSPQEVDNIEGKLWDFITQQASTLRSVTEYDSFPYIDSGWEWSIFQKDATTVVKIPAGIFPEVDAEAYLKNTQYAYEALLRFFPQASIAQTVFLRQNNQNIQIQEYIYRKKNYYIGYNTRNQIMLENIASFLTSALQMLEQQEWLPDFDVRRARGGFVLRNVIIEKQTHIPKIIDFTSYYDTFRLYSERKDRQVAHKKQTMKDLLTWIRKP